MKAVYSCVVVWQVSMLEWAPGPTSSSPRKPVWLANRVLYVWRGRVYVTPAATSSEAQITK